MAPGSVGSIALLPTTANFSRSARENNYSRRIAPKWGAYAISAMNALQYGDPFCRNAALANGIRDPRRPRTNHLVRHQELLRPLAEAVCGHRRDQRPGIRSTSGKPAASSGASVCAATSGAGAPDSGPDAETTCVLRKFVCTFLDSPQEHTDMYVRQACGIAVRPASLRRRVRICNRPHRPFCRPCLSVGGTDLLPFRRLFLLLWSSDDHRRRKRRRNGKRENLRLWAEKVPRRV